jgi:regulatory protein
MQTITALTVQKKNKDRVNVFLDGAFAFGLPYATAVTLKVGQSLSPAEIEALQQENLLDKVKNSALRLISYRPRSVAEVRRHLDRKGHDPHLINTAITHLQTVDLLNDEKFAQYWIEQRETFKPRSRMALHHELRQKGVSREIIEAALVNLDETAAARRAAEKKARRWANLPEPLFRKKLGGFLQRRGFHYEIIKETMDELWSSLGSNGERDGETAA